MIANYTLDIFKVIKQEIITQVDEIDLYLDAMKEQLDAISDDLEML